MMVCGQGVADVQAEYLLIMHAAGSSLTSSGIAQTCQECISIYLLISEPEQFAISDTNTMPYTHQWAY